MTHSGGHAYTLNPPITRDGSQLVRGISKVSIGSLCNTNELPDDHHSVSCSFGINAQGDLNRQTVFRALRNVYLN